MKRYGSLLPTVAVLLALPLVCVSAQDLLWRAYSQGSPENKALLAESLARMASVRQKALTATQEPDWNADADVQWLMSHRIPTMLVVEQEYDRQHEGFQIEAMVHMTVGLGAARLTKHLPALLQEANTEHARMKVLRVMADLRDKGSVAALERFLTSADATTPEDQICQAARGLSLTRDGKHQAALIRASGMVVSEPARTRLAAARYLCGEAEMAQRILDVLDKKDADRAARFAALDFFAENPLQKAVPSLADLAARSEDGPVAARAWEVLLHTTGYSVPPPELRERPADAQRADASAEEDKRPAGSLPEPAEMAKLPRAERDKYAMSILKWWVEHPEARPQAIRQIARTEALAATCEGESR